MADQIRIQHIFTTVDPNTGVTFTDALNLDRTAYDALTPGQILALKTARFNAWRAAVANPPAQGPPPTLVQQVQAINDQIAGLDAQRADLVTQRQAIIRNG